MDFFILAELKTFDGIIGDDTLKELEAVIDGKKKYSKNQTKYKHTAERKTVVQLNNIEIRGNHLSEEIRENSVHNYKIRKSPRTDK